MMSKKIVTFPLMGSTGIDSFIPAEVSPRKCPVPQLQSCEGDSASPPEARLSSTQSEGLAVSCAARRVTYDS